MPGDRNRLFRGLVLLLALSCFLASCVGAKSREGRSRDTLGQGAESRDTKSQEAESRSAQSQEGRSQSESDPPAGSPRPQQERAGAGGEGGAAAPGGWREEFRATDKRTGEEAARESETAPVFLPEGDYGDAEPDLPGRSEGEAPELLSGIELFPAGTVLAGDRIESGQLERYFTAREIQRGGPVYERINGRSFQEEGAVPLSELRYLKMLHYNYEHEIQVGEMIVNQAAAGDVLEIFMELFQNEYEIGQMHLIDGYWSDGGETAETAGAGSFGEDGREEGGTGEAGAERETAVIGFRPLRKDPQALVADGVGADAQSMKYNNTSAFNDRTVPGKKSKSRHSLGLAVDVNPGQNPYVVFDESGSPRLEYDGDLSYIDREDLRPHMIDHEDLACLLFLEHGFQWGGDWNSSRDYQHFDRKP